MSFPDRQILTYWRWPKASVFDDISHIAPLRVGYSLFFIKWVKMTSHSGKNKLNWLVKYITSIRQMEKIISIRLLFALFFIVVFAWRYEYDMALHVISTHIRWGFSFKEYERHPALKAPSSHNLSELLSSLISLFNFNERGLSSHNLMGNSEAFYF